MRPRILLPLSFVICWLSCIGFVASDCSALSATPIVLTISNVSIASQNTNTYGVRLDVGEPRQNLCLMPSTVVDNTLLVSKNICSTTAQNMTQAQCRSYHGGTFDVAAAQSSFTNVSIAATLPSDPGWAKFNPPFTVAGSTNINLVSNIAVPNTTVVVITEGMNFTAGHLGLGRQSTLLKHLKNSNMIPSLSFGLNAGSQSILSPRDGSLVLGGYDKASPISSFYSYPMNYSDTIAGRYCPLQVHIQNLQLVLQGIGPIELIGEGDGHYACIEPYDTRFRFSRVGLDRFKQYTGWNALSTARPSNLYIPEPGLTYPASTGFNGSLKFTLDDNMVVDIPNHELQHPLRGIDPSGNPALQPDITELNIYGDPLEAWVLSKAFLSRVYLAVDYEAGSIQLAEVNQNKVTPDPTPFSSTYAHCKKKNLSGGTIAAIALGAFLGLVVIILTGYCIYKKRRKTTTDPAPKTTASPSAEDIEILPHAERVTSYTSDLTYAPAAQDGGPLQRWEISGERRTFELPSPNGGYPPPSPRAPDRRLQRRPVGSGGENGSGSTWGQLRANAPWHV